MANRKYQNGNLLLFRRVNYETSIIKKINLLSREQCCTATGHLYRLWGRYTSSVGKVNIYAAKVDVQDAFGNVDTGT